MNESSFIIRFSSTHDITAIEARSRRTFARHSHAEFGIGVITQGAQRSWSGRGTVEAGFGDLITCNPGEVHDGAPIGVERAWSMLYLSPSLVGSIAADFGDGTAATKELRAPVVRDARALRRFTEAYSAVKGEKTDSAFVDERLVLLLGTLLRDAVKPSRGTAGRLALAREHIDDDPAASHRLDHLASLAGVSRFQAIRGFVRMTGLTPHAYIVQRRVELARRLIRTGTGIAEAATAAAFADQSHLHRVFTARYGLTPGAYARAANRSPSCNFVQYRSGPLP